MSSAFRAWPLLTAILAVVAATTCSCPPAAEEPTAPAPAPEPAEPGEPAPEPPAPDEPAPRSDGASVVDPSHPLYGRVEGASFANDCETAADCHVSGCSSEICSAEPGVASTCEAREWPTAGASCGCVDGQCVWHRLADGADVPAEDAGAPAPGATLPAQGQSCPEGRCAAGLSCLRYYGIAGAQGPELTSCEIACAKGGACPEGQRCVTIADGPGQVCRPAK